MIYDLSVMKKKFIPSPFEIEFEGEGESLFEGFINSSGEEDMDISRGITRVFFLQHKVLVR